MAKPRLIATVSQVKGEDHFGPPQGEKVGDSVITVVTDCPPETGATRSEATEGVDSFRFRLSLRSLSRVASDYSSGSVVCIGNSASFASFA